MNEWLNARLKALLTLLTLSLLLVFGAVWGLHAVTAPFPGRATAPLCTPRAVAAGSQVYPAEVLVNVYNASTQAGLATNAMSMFAERGFGQGSTGNQVGEKVAVATIWTTTPQSPDVLLVLKQLGKGAVVKRHQPMGPGVTVLVGPKFAKLTGSGGNVKAKKATQICSPPVG